MKSLPKDYGHDTIPIKIRSKVCENINGLNIHYIETGWEDKSKPLLVLLHGFPELAYSWRKVIIPLSEAGYHVIAPDQRGFGRTTGWDNSYVEDLSSFNPMNLVRDILGLVFALGYSSVQCIVGHDSGAGVAGWSSIIRPDIYKSVILMSAPFAGPPAIPFDIDGKPNDNLIQNDTIVEDLASLERPRKHYQHYYRTIEANNDMMNAKDGLSSFIRGYYHYKSADWKGNVPFELESWTASELAKMPTYYIMDFADNMAQTVAKQMPSKYEIELCKWLTEEELSVYATEYGRTGFQGGLNWYRRGGNKENHQKLELFSGKQIEIPSLFIAGKQDWGPYQRPGALSHLQKYVCSNMSGIKLVDNAGHWVQQEQPEEVSKLILEFLKKNFDDY